MTKHKNANRTQKPLEKSHSPYKPKFVWRDKDFSVERSERADLRKWLRQKNKTASIFINDYMERRPSHPTPKIALCCSGGGLRASYASRCFTKILAEEGLWEAIIVWAGLSGGIWFMGDYLVNGSEFAWTRKKEPSLDLKDILPKGIEKWDSLSDVILADYARVLGNAYFPNYRPSKWYFSDHIPKTLSSPLPIIASIDDKNRWYSINPLETKRIESNSSILTECLGLPSALPLDDLVTLMALCSSSISKYVPNLAYKVPNWEKDSDKKSIALMDAGLDYNLPFPLLERYDMDLIICLDVSHTNFNGEQLYKAYRTNRWLPKITKENREAIAAARPCLIKGKKTSILYVPMVEQDWSTFNFHPKRKLQEGMRRIVDDQWKITRKILRNYFSDFGRTSTSRDGDKNWFSNLRDFLK